MPLKSALKKDYMLLPILSVIYFLTIKSIISSSVYLLISIVISIYFFPIKLFLGNDSTLSNNKRRIVVLLSYFIISNIIALSALVAYQGDLGFIRSGIFIYSLINVSFLIYFHMTERGSYNFILTGCAVIFTTAVTIIS